MRRATLGISLVFGVMLVVEAAAVTHPIVPADRAQRAARLIDRTLHCSVPLHAGVRQIRAAATTGTRDQENRSRWKHLANVTVAAGGGVYNSVGLVGGAAGAPEPTDVLFPGAGQGVYIERACRLVSARVPLTTRGLPQGGIASPLRDSYECVAPRTVLVRVRARFSVPTRLRLRGGTLQSGAPVREVVVAVRTTTGKPLVYASASESGKARLFTAGNCFPD
jgi:hypothetical protein